MFDILIHSALSTFQQTAAPDFSPIKIVSSFNDSIFPR